MFYFFFFFFFNDTATTEIYTLSLHDALPIWRWSCAPGPLTPGARSGSTPQADAGAVIGCWQDGHLPGRRFGRLSDEEALALERPAMALARAWLGDRLARQLSQASRQWRHAGRRRP